jgi:deoxyribonuclease V
MPLLAQIPTRWDVTPAQARAEQEALAGRVALRPLGVPPRLVAGADTSYDRGSNRVAGAVVVWDTQEMAVVETATAIVDTPFPYVPGLLTFREAPALMPAFARLVRTPDLLVFNGHGIAHPRRMGLAAHMGVLLGRPSVGVAKGPLVGTHSDVGPRPGDWAPLTWRGEVVGAALRTKDRCLPVYVSPGHRSVLADAIRFALDNCLGYKLPAVIREAHALCNRVRRGLTPDALECAV